jgi:hypothetical protein
VIVNDELGPYLGRKKGVRHSVLSMQLFLNVDECLEK